MTTVALVNYKDQIEKESPGFDRKKFIYRLDRTEYEKDFGTQYTHPGVGSRILAFLFDILPKVGPLKIFALKVPDPTEQGVYLKSINGTVDKFIGYLAGLQAQPANKSHSQPAPDLAEIDLDTGKPSELGEYRLADEAYAKLLHTLVRDPKQAMLPEVRRSFQDFYAKRTEPTWYQKKPKRWRLLTSDLASIDASARAAVTERAGQ